MATLAECERVRYCNWLRCSSIFLTMKRLESRKRSTQFCRHDCSLLERRVDGVLVMHLLGKGRRARGRGQV